MLSHANQAFIRAPRSVGWEGSEAVGPALLLKETVNEEIKGVHLINNYLKKMGLMIITYYVLLPIYAKEIRTYPFLLD